ncbi:5-oxoprolinase subunit PxpB [Sediminibacterium sp.]|uniref:5-oxoprolinase subunit PxpB n=1 Tax=Sediminibacterium sp. TaxID=1917865 RepID=UPI003F6F87FB
MLKKTIPHIYALGDQAITIEWSSTISEEVNNQVMHSFQFLGLNPIEGITDMIPAYSSLTLIYNPGIIRKQAMGGSPFEWLKKKLATLTVAPSLNAKESTPQIVPVCYDLSLAPDLIEATQLTGCTIEEIIALHTSKIYKVYMLGFLPGFAYMASVNQRIQMPRKSNPRKMVKAGSVGIAGEQTGIYPIDAPGGWQLIGQTPMKIFDITKEDPCLFKPGYFVQFKAITLEQFHQFNTV